MDNAIEALEKVRESEKVLSVKMIYDEPNLVIHISNNYEGEITTDFYGRRVPKHAHGTIKFDYQTSSTDVIMKKTMELFT